MAFTRSIHKNSDFSHQTSPGYVLTFIRWSNRDTINYNIKPQDIRKPLVVINDAVSVQVSDSKASVTGSCNIVLKASDINYATAIAPGDFLTVNLVDNENKAAQIAEKALALQPINEYEDGFKGLYKVQKVRRQINTDPASGRKTYQYVVHAFSFTEFKTKMYYNPTAAKAFEESRLLFLSQFADWWSTVSTNRDNQNNVQKILVKLTKALLGEGLRNKLGDLSIEATSNDQFKMPSGVAALLGIPSGNRGFVTVSDVYHFIFGIWKDKQVQNSASAEGNKEKIAQSFNPNIKAYKGNTTFFKAGTEELQGWRLLAAQDFNYKEIWSIIQSFMNAGINEAYTANRVSLDSRVYPTLIVRQKPFTSEHFTSPPQVNNKKGKKGPPTPFTRYFELPRWRIDPDLIYSVDLGKDEIARVNYVQLYGRSISVQPGYNESLQAQNIFFDQDDIQRHGLKPAIITTNFDFPLERGNTSSDAKRWAWLLFDILNAGQNRESGSIVAYGIQEPICVGDNLRFDGNIYHIESVTHTMQIQAGGRKIWRTSLNLSFGTNLASNKSRPVYPQQENTFVDRETVRDYEEIGEKILPGISESQLLPYSERSGNRKDGEQVKNPEQREGGQQSFTGTGKTQTGPGRASTVNINFDDKEEENVSRSGILNKKKKKD